MMQADYWKKSILVWKKSILVALQVLMDVL